MAVRDAHPNNQTYLTPSIWRFRATRQMMPTQTYAGWLNAVAFAPSPDRELVDPTKRVYGRITGPDGQAYAGAYVALYRVEDNLRIATTASDASGDYTFPRNSFDGDKYYVVAWTTSGQPLQTASPRTVTPE